MPKSEKADITAINDTLKEALFSCARDEIRKLVLELIGSQNHTPKSSSHVSTLGVAKNGRLSSNRNGQSSKQCATNKYISTIKNTRPNTAYFLRPSPSGSSKPRRTKSCKRLKGYREKVTMTREDREEMYNNPSESVYAMSFASTKLIEKSADIISKSSNEVCDIGNTKTGKSNKNVKSETHYNHPILLSEMSDTFPFFKRPKSAYIKSDKIKNPMISKIKLGESTTALERRVSNRPSTAHLVRAKTEDLGKKLLHPISLESSTGNLSPILFAMDEKKWENELARYIVSVYNNKVVSDVKSDDCPCTLAGKSQFPPSQVQKDFFNRSPVTVSNSFSAERNGIIKTTPVDLQSELCETKHFMKATIPRMVWLGGDGDACQNWDELEGKPKLIDFPSEKMSIHQSLKNLLVVSKTFNLKIIQQLYREGKYVKYIMVVKSEICSIIASRPRENAFQHELLWRKLFLCSISFASKLVRKGKYSQAIELLEVATDLQSNDYIQSESGRQQLDGILKDTKAYYYSRRGKPSAALQYIIGATNSEKQSIATNCRSRHDFREVLFPVRLTKCYLHRAYILHQLHRFEEAMDFMRRVLCTVDIYLRRDTTINEPQSCKVQSEIGPDDPEIMLMIALTYHNIAVIQILKGHIGDACISSQNCRRLCRLCMSVSSRYINQFEETHMKALSEMSSMLRCKQTKEEASVFQKLVVGLFD